MKRFIYVWAACMIGIIVLVSCTLAAQDEVEGPGDVSPEPGVEEDLQFVSADVERQQGVSVSDEATAATVIGMAVSEIPRAAAGA